MNAETSKCFNRRHARLRAAASLLVLVAAGFMPALSAADPAVIATADSDTWKFAATVYGWFPDHP